MCTYTHVYQLEKFSPVSLLSQSRAGLGAWSPYTIPQAGQQCGRGKPRFVLANGRNAEKCSNRVKDEVGPNTRSMRCRQEHISWGGAAGWHFGTGYMGTA